MDLISKHAKIGKNVIISPGVIIEDNVEVGDNTFLDYGAILKKNVKLGSNAFVGARCIIGEYDSNFMKNRFTYIQPDLIIGNNALIRSETIIYAGSTIGENFQTGHRVTIREKSQIGNNFRIGTLSDIQGDCVIGDYVNCHSNVHIGQKSNIGSYVWIFPFVVLTNDPTPPSYQLCGVNIEDYAVICTMAVILPGITIKKGCLVGAGSVVNKDVHDEMVVVGNPAKEVMHTSKIKNKLTGKNVYPWYKNFDRGMPWDGVGYENWVLGHTN